MKTRHSLVSNSSSTSFIVDGNIRDEELRKRLWSVINDIATYIEPDDIEIPTQMYISTGMSQGNECLFKWWQLKKWFVDNKIKHQDSGDGCPELQQRSCDFICYITERDNEQKKIFKVILNKNKCTFVFFIKFIHAHITTNLNLRAFEFPNIRQP